jgi:tetratricopeptide (TPR) repeat protein
MDMERMQETIENAKKAFQQGNYKSAITGFEAAKTYYESQKDVLNTAEMANNLSVALLQAGKKKQALEVVQGTAEIFQQHDDPKRQAIALGNQAAALDALKEYDTAISLYEQSAELLKKVGEKELASHVLKSISLIQVRKGKQLDGVFSMQQSLNNIENPTLWQRFYRWLLKIPFKLLGR